MLMNGRQRGVRAFGSPLSSLTALALGASLTAGCTIEKPTYVPNLDSGLSGGESSSEPTATSPGASVSPSASLQGTSAPSAAVPSGDPSAEPSASPSSMSTLAEPGPDAAPSIASDAAATAPEPDMDAAVPSASTQAPDPDAAPPEPMAGDVVGHIVDFYGHPVANVMVTIGEVTVFTDAQGAFSVEDVPEQYDVDFLIELNANAPPEYAYAYRYEHLTRRDPTLQVYRGVAERQSHVVLTPDVEPEADDLMYSTFGTVDGSYQHSVGDTGSDFNPVWFGPAATTSELHALWWRTTDDLPTSYLGFFQQTVALTSGANATHIELAFADQEPVSALNISGTVSSLTADYRTNQAYVVFSSRGAIELLTDYPSMQDFTYLVPNLPNASILVLAQEGRDYDFGSYAYKQGLAAGQSNVEITVPTPAHVLTPEYGDTIDETTTYTWTGGGPVSVLTVVDDGFYQAYIVVTDAKQASIPNIPGAGMRPNGEYVWHVENHGTCSTMDECAGPNGALDPMSWDRGAPAKITKDGSYARSDSVYVVTGP